MPNPNQQVASTDQMGHPAEQYINSPILKCLKSLQIIPYLEIACGLVGVVALLLAAVADLGDVERLLGVLALEVVLPLAKLSALLSLYLSNRDHFRFRF